MKEVPHCDLHDPELDIEKAVEAAEKWGEEHPEKTMAQDFFEKHPNAPTYIAGIPHICPYYCGYVKNKECPEYEDIESSEGSRCIKCWSRPLEDV